MTTHESYEEFMRRMHRLCSTPNPRISVHGTEYILVHPYTTESDSALCIHPGGTDIYTVHQENGQWEYGWR